MARGAAYRGALVASVLVALAAALGPTGCVLFVPDDSYGADCRFAGASAGCGACVAAHCQASVNACCGDRACAPDLAVLERCTTGDASGCADLGASTGAIGRCVQSTCAAACSISGASSGPDASTNPHDGGGTSDAGPTSTIDAGGGDGAKVGTTSCTLTAGAAKCSCTQEGTPNSVQCTLDTFGDRTNTLCYKGSGTCQCAHMGCHAKGAQDCTCNLPDYNAGDPVCDQTGLICCVAGFGLCDCSNFDCGGAIQVTTCTVSEMVSLLPGQYQLVDHCSE